MQNAPPESVLVPVACVVSAMGMVANPSGTADSHGTHVLAVVRIRYATFEVSRGTIRVMDALPGIVGAGERASRPWRRVLQCPYSSRAGTTPPRTEGTTSGLWCEQ